MAKSPLADLIIRTGTVRLPDVGYLLAADPRREEEEEPHTVFFKWSGGEFKPGSMNFSAHSCCLISDPGLALVCVGGNGHYSITTPAAKPVGNIFENSLPKATGPRYGDISSVSTVAGKAIAVGVGGLAYRLDTLSGWTRIDEGLPESFDAMSVHGFGADDLYAVGSRGDIWRYDGQNWSKCDTPTNANLNSVCCAPDGMVYAAGRGGVLLSGRATTWKMIEHRETEDDFWDLEWFSGELYLSTMSALFCLRNGELRRRQFGKDVPGTCYHLSATSDVLWSIGEEDVLSFDGKNWTRVI
jgi:hypothetical protein